MKPPVITEDLKQAVKTVLTARAYKQSIEPKIKAIQTQVMEQYKFQYKPENKDLQKTEYLVNPDHTYLISDADFDIYIDECNKLYHAAGFKVARGYCPLLMAQSAERTALRAMVDLSAYIAASQGLDAESMERLYYNMDHLRTYQEAIIGLVVSLTPKKYFALV